MLFFVLLNPGVAVENEQEGQMVKLRSLVASLAGPSPESVRTDAEERLVSAGIAHVLARCFSA